MNKTKQQRLDQIKADIIEKNICPDLAQTATQLVMGDGNPDADIVFIGEAPGKNEDAQGLPFVGAAGTFLDEMLASVEMNRQDIFITNIVKYRPPDNRDPLPEEKAAFFPYLEAQLSVIEPKLIVTLGRHSMNAFLPEFKISQVHGQPYRRKFVFHQPVKFDAQDETEAHQEQTSHKQVRTVVILPLYHPAAALYNGGMRQTLLDDFANVPIILSKIK